MLQYAIVFLIISIIAGIFGFTGTANTTKTIAKVLFALFLIFFVLTLIFGGVAIWLNSKDPALKSRVSKIHGPLLYFFARPLAQ